MSGKKSIPKPKTKRKPKRKNNQARDYAFLNRRIDVIQQQCVNLVEWSDKVAKMLHYNQILPEPENRWIPSIAGDPWMLSRFRQRKKR